MSSARPFRPHSKMHNARGEDALMSERRVVLGVTGSVAAYRAADVVRELRRQGCFVRCILTHDGARFITSTTLAAVSGERVYTDLWEPADQADELLHIALADWAELLLVAPATAATIANLAYAHCDGLLGCVAAATQAPVVVAPAMNTNMYQHAAVQRNISALKELGYHIVDPIEGELACGVSGVGHLAEIDTIVGAVTEVLK